MDYQTTRLVDLLGGLAAAGNAAIAASILYGKPLAGVICNCWLMVNLAGSVITPLFPILKLIVVLLGAKLIFSVKEPKPGSNKMMQLGCTKGTPATISTLPNKYGAQVCICQVTVAGMAPIILIMLKNY